MYRDVSGMFTTESRAASSRDDLSLRSHSEAETVIQDIRCVRGGREEMREGLSLQTGLMGWLYCHLS